MFVDEINVKVNKNVRVRKVIDCRVPDNIFKIGHSKSESETFLPKTHYDAKSGITFVDVAGFNDTGGDLIEIINNFVMK